MTAELSRSCLVSSVSLFHSLTDSRYHFELHSIVKNHRSKYAYLVYRVLESLLLRVGMRQCVCVIFFQFHSSISLSVSPQFKDKKTKGSEQHQHDRYHDKRNYVRRLGLGTWTQKKQKAAILMLGSIILELLISN